MILNPEVMRHKSEKREEAEAIVAESYCDHQLRMSEDNAVDFRFNSAAFTASRFNTLKYGPSTSVACAGFTDFYMLEMPIKGGSKVEICSKELQSAPGKALFLSPQLEFRSVWHPSTSQLMLQINKELFDRKIQQFSDGKSGLTSNAEINLNCGYGKKISYCFSKLAEGISFNGRVFHDPDEIVEDIIQLLLCNLAFQNKDSIVPERFFVAPRYVKRAVELFNDRYTENLSMPEVAKEVGTSERAFFLGFQLYYQCTPRQFLERVRMQQAKKLIANADIPIKDVAIMVGMPHAGRFSATYRKYHGYSPSAHSPNQYRA